MAQLIAETFLNGVQAGVFLFLIAAGLTLVFGIMNMVNLAHGSLFMMGAYFAAFFFREVPGFTESMGMPVGPALGFLIAIMLALPLSLLLGIALEFLALRTLYQRDHLDQVLATFGFILFFNQLVLVVFGAESQTYQLPESIEEQVTTRREEFFAEQQAADVELVLRVGERRTDRVDLHTVGLTEGPQYVRLDEIVEGEALALSVGQTDERLKRRELSAPRVGTP